MSIVKWNHEPVNNKQVFFIKSQTLLVNGEETPQYFGNYYCNIGDTVELTGEIVDGLGGNVTSFTLPVPLKLPIVRHANDAPTTDEIYMNVNVVEGVITAQVKFERSGNWKMLTARTNEALIRISAPFKIQSNDISFLV